MKPIAPNMKITAIQRCSREKLEATRSEFELLVAKQEKRLRNFIIKHFGNPVADIITKGKQLRKTWFGIRGNL